MRALPMRALGLAALFLTIGAADGTETKASAKKTTPADVQALAKKIDQHVARGWAKAKVKPAPLADDAELMRRVYLDLSGRIPSVAEARRFLSDDRSNKRALLVEELLSRAGYVDHFTNVWRARLIPEANNNFLVRLQQNSFEAWLKERVKRNAHFDEMARDLVTASLGEGGPQAIASSFTGDASPIAFFSAKEFKPESLAAGTARVFLGVSVECAQCHDHFFADWNREQFWGFAAFYSGVKSQQTTDIILPNGEDPEKRELKIPGTDKVVQATYLDGAKPDWKPKAKTREVLAKWLASPSNRYFSRAGANFYWAYFFGTGLVEPVDEMVGEKSRASHPELLELLAREFAAHEFDTKFMIRVLTSTRAYQLSSASTDAKQDDPTFFARGHLRGLTPEQLFDSVATATGYRDAGNSNNYIAAILGGQQSARSEFLTKFHSTERATESQTSILQALSLMNGRVVAAATSLEQSETLAAVVEAPFVSTKERVKTLYLATLSRYPNKRELDRVVNFVDRSTEAADPNDDGKGEKTDYANALADVFWALLNSSEFVLNH